jgi:hypothetical protein
MSVERNKTMTRKWLLEAFNNCDLSLVEECLTEDYINHGTTEVRGYEGGRHILTQPQAWGPDGKIVILLLARFNWGSIDENKLTVTIIVACFIVILSAIILYVGGVFLYKTWQSLKGEIDGDSERS